MPAITDRLLAHARSLIRVARLEPFDGATPEGRSLERYRRIVLSTGASLAGTVVSTLVGVLTVPLVLNGLGKDFYGLWVSVLSMTPWVALLDLGMVAGLVVAMAEANGRNDRAGAHAAFSTAFFALLVVGTLAAVGVLGVLVLAPWEALLRMPPGTAGPSVAWGVAMVGALACLSLPLGLVPQAFAGYQRAYVATLFSAGGGLLSLGALFIVVRSGAPPVAVFAVVSGAGFLAALGSLAWLVRSMPWLRPSTRVVSRSALRRLFGTATPLYLFQVGSLLVNQTQRPLLAARAGLDVTAEYDLLFRIYLLGVTLITVSTASVAPTLRESLERGDPDWMRRTFWRLVRLRVVAAAVLGAVLVAGGNAVLRVWLGRDDLAFGPFTWMALAVLLLVAVWGSAFFELMTIFDRIWPQVAVVLVQGPVTIGLTWVLAGRHGALGAVVALALPSLALSGWILPVLARRLLRHGRGGTAQPAIAASGRVPDR